MGGASFLAVFKDPPPQPRSDGERKEEGEAEQWQHPVCKCLLREPITNRVRHKNGTFIPVAKKGLFGFFRCNILKKSFFAISALCYRDGSSSPMGGFFLFPAILFRRRARAAHSIC